MATTCTTSDTTDFCPGTNNLACLSVGYTFPDRWEFTDADGEIDITADDFEMIIKDADGNVIDTLTVGAGLTIVPDNKLDVLIGSPTTDTAGTYTYKLIWTETATGGQYPVLVGKIIVKP